MSAHTHDIATDPTVQGQLERSRARLVDAPRGRERSAEAIAGGLFLVAALVLAVVATSEAPSPLAVLLLVAAYAITLRVEFEVGPGYTVPTLLVLVPMLYLLPAPIVPLCVVAATLVSYLVNVVLGRRNLRRVAVVFGQGWHALGAALVFTVLPPADASWDDWAVVLAAFGAYVAFDAAASLSVDHFGHREPLGSLLGSAMWVYLVDLLLLPVGLMVAIAAEGHVVAVTPLAPLCVLLGVFGRERRRRLDQALELSQAYRGTALLLGDVVEHDDGYTGAHSRDVVDLALAVGRRLGLDAGRQRKLEFGALLHDVGKIAVPKAILHKPGPLDAAEWEVMRRHTIEGQRMLDAVGGVLADVGVVVPGSHERYDGGGYPDGLAGDAIPIESASARPIAR